MTAPDDVPPDDLHGPGCRALRADRFRLDLDDVPPGQVVDGNPRAGLRELAELAGVSVGVWEHTTGVSRDVEADEIFVVLAGEATVEVEDGDPLELGPGTVGVLRAGARTMWHVRTPLRKIYLTPTVPSDAL